MRVNLSSIYDYVCRNLCFCCEWFLQASSFSHGYISEWFFQVFLFYLEIFCDIYINKITSLFYYLFLFLFKNFKKIYEFCFYFLMLFYYSYAEFHIFFLYKVLYCSGSQTVFRHAPPKHVCSTRPLFWNMKKSTFFTKTKPKRKLTMIGQFPFL